MATDAAMSEETGYSQTVETVASGESHSASGGLMEPSVPLMTLTWITFLLLVIVLYKVAWKPILKGLDQRERGIRKALDDAEHARAETAALEIKRQQMMQEAQAESQRIMTQAREAAAESLHAAETRAQETGRQMVETARNEIAAATEQARVQLRRDSAELAVTLAGKLVRQNLDSDRNRALVDEWAKEL